MEMSLMPSEQHLPYRSTADVVVLDGDGSRWVRETNGTCPDANRTCPDNVPFSPKNVASSPVASRKPIRKVEAWCVVDFGGVYGRSWVQPVLAFTDYCKAIVCRYIREQRREKPRDGVSCPIDYIGSCVKRIEVVIDE